MSHICFIIFPGKTSWFFPWPSPGSKGVRVQVTCRVGVHHGHCVGGVVGDPRRAQLRPRKVWPGEKHGEMYRWYFNSVYIYICIYIYSYLSTYLSIYLPTYLSIYPSIHLSTLYMEVSWNRGTCKSSIFIGFSIIDHPAIGESGRKWRFLDQMGISPTENSGLNCKHRFYGWTSSMNETYWGITWYSNYFQLYSNISPWHRHLVGLKPHSLQSYPIIFQL